MISIAITGGIGSGKSYVSNWLMEQNIPIYNADNEAKRLMLSICVAIMTAEVVTMIQ